VPNPVADKLQVAVVGETCHSRVVACPEVTDDAAEVSVTVGAETVALLVVVTAALTVTITFREVEPPDPVQVAVYVVV
jgi:hypothetical protein